MEHEVLLVGPEDGRVGLARALEHVVQVGHLVLGLCEGQWFRTYCGGDWFWKVSVFASKDGSKGGKCQVDGREIIYNV